LSHLPLQEAPCRSRRKKEIDLETLSQYFHMTIQDASKALDISGTSLKKICRKYGLERWPHRKVR